MGFNELKTLQRVMCGMENYGNFKVYKVVTKKAR